jgi:hypothetical protein
MNNNTENLRQHHHSSIQDDPDFPRHRVTHTDSGRMVEFFEYDYLSEESWETNTGTVVDVYRLSDGTIVVVSDEGIGIYRGEEEYHNGTGVFVICPAS